jgi:glutathione S-transferase
MIDAELTRHAYIAGDALTLCDIPWGVHAHRWFGMNYLGLSRPELPALRAWYEKLCERPAYKQHIAGCPIA